MTIFYRWFVEVKQIWNSRRRGTREWPIKSPDLKPIKLYLKSKYFHRSTKIEQMKDKISVEISKNNPSNNLFQLI